MSLQRFKGMGLILVLGLTGLMVPATAGAAAAADGGMAGELAGDDDGPPALPSGLDDSSAAPPTLPAGLEEPADAPAFSEPSPISLHGFADLRAGARLEGTALASQNTMAEARVQLDLKGEWSAFAFSIVADGVADLVLKEWTPDLERGHGLLDLRETNITVSPTHWLDLKLGRQILTWGTGDLLFINDLFPKDWTSFLIGRDMEYLKAPSDAARLTLYASTLTIDFVYVPAFDSDRYPDRRRIISWDGMAGRPAGADLLPAEDRPQRWFRDFELHGRMGLTVASMEFNLYGSYGFWKSPAGFRFADPLDPLAGGFVTWPALATWGLSVRAPLLGGIINAEGGHYISLDDEEGDDPLIANSEVRFLLGYERELLPRFTVGLQYYAELTLDHDAYLAGLQPGAPVKDALRHVVTARLTLRALRDRLQASLFTFFGPSELDVHLRPHLSYAIDDVWRVEAGASLFFGADPWSFYAQFEGNNSLWFATRASW